VVGVFTVLAVQWTPVTVDNGQCTPITVYGAERRGEVWLIRTARVVALLSLCCISLPLDQVSDITLLAAALQVSIDRNPSQQRPFGLYGNMFTAASESAIKQAVRVIDPPTHSNIFVSLSSFE